MKCIIYARFSPRPDEDTSDSNDKQIDACLEYAVHQDWEVVEVFEDRGKSRDDPARPGMTDAIAALKKGMTLLCYDSSRFGGGIAAAVYEDNVYRKKASIAFVVGGSLQDSLEGKMLRQIMYAVNQYQRAQIAARTRDKMRKQQDEGHVRSHILPFGYMRDPKNPKMMLPCPDEQETIALMKRLRAENLSFSEIARSCTEQHRAARSGKWHRGTIKKVLDREARAGR